MDDKNRENEGDLMIAGLLITSRQMAFMVRNTTGIICAATTHEHAMNLDLQPMILKTRTFTKHYLLFLLILI